MWKQCKLNWAAVCVASAMAAACNTQSNASPTAPTSDVTPHKVSELNANAAVSRDAAEFVRYEALPPASLNAGQTFAVRVTFKNSGTTAWTPSAPNGGYKLGVQCPGQDTNIWQITRVPLAVKETVPVGASKTFTITAKAPNFDGSYKFCWQMVREGISWFGSKSPAVSITIGKPPATLDDLWDGKAQWIRDSKTGLPDAYTGDVFDAPDGSGQVWAITHQPFPPSIPFPGCAVLYVSRDAGKTFALDTPTRPCIADDGADRGTINGQQWYQQQYPQVSRHGDQLIMVYEHAAAQFFRTSRDGRHWSARTHIPTSGACVNGNCGHFQWETRHRGCDNDAEDVGTLRGSVPGIYSDGSSIYVFYGGGTYPGSMGVFVGSSMAQLRAYSSPLVTAPYNTGQCRSGISSVPSQFAAKYVTSANVLRHQGRYYMTFEGQRKFNEWGLGLARTSTGAPITSRWEINTRTIGPLGAYPGVGHAAFYERDGVLYLYRGVSTSVSGFTAERFRLSR